MAGRHFGVVLRRIERLFTAGSVAGLSEGQLIERFATRRDEAAFEAIVARYGPMVLGICRQVLRDPDDVEDAFQATFLVLVRKAGTLRDRDLVGNWLFGVASRVALRARAVAARRRAVEGSGADVEAFTGNEGGTGAGAESRPWLHEEVRRLPEKYRVPVVLCYLEGLTHEETARRLGWPIGTVKGRLARARELLHRRLTRRGVGLSTSALAVVLARDARASVSPALVESTVKVALSVASGRALAAGAVAANVAALMEGVLNAMFWNKLNTAAATLLAAGVVAIGVGGWAYRAAGEDEGKRAGVAQRFERRAQPGGKRVATAAAADPGPGPGDLLLSDLEFSTIVGNAQDSFANMLETTRLHGGRFEDLERIIRWSNHELESELDLGGHEPQRREALMSHADRMKRLHELTQRLPQSDPDQPAKADLARTQRQSAERRMGKLGEAVAAQPSATVGTTGAGPGGGQGIVDQAHLARIEGAPLAARIAARANTPANRAILARLEEPVSMSFANETPLEDVLKYIKSATQGSNDAGIPIYVDPAGLAEVQKTTTSPVALDLEGVPLKTTLRLLLKQLGLAYCINDGVLMIGSPAGILKELEEAEARPDEPAPARPRSRKPAPAGPAPEVPPGNETASAEPGLEAPPAHQPAPVESAPAMPPPGSNPAPPGTQSDAGMLKSNAIGETLDQPVKLSIAHETPLADVLKTLKKATRGADGSEIQIYVDPAVRKQLQSPVEFDLEEVPLRTSLSLLLNQVGLEWTVQDGLLIISTRDGLIEYRRIAAHFTGVGALDGMFPVVWNEKAQQKLNAPITLSFPEATPLEDVLKAIRDTTNVPGYAGLPVYFGPPVLYIPDEHGNTRPLKIGKMLVRIDVKEIPLRTCLALLLAQKDGDQNIQLGRPVLDGRIVNGLLIIGGHEWIGTLSVPQRGGIGGGMGGLGGQGMR